jgi:colanic acid/amylovoran biosynthesis glycosyltransferase
MKKLKILFLVPSFPTVSETFIVNQIIDLIDKGHDVRIFAITKNDVPVHSKILEYSLLDNIIFANLSSNILKRLMLFFKTFFLSSKEFRKNILKSLNFFKYGFSAFKLSVFCKIEWLTKINNEFDIVHAHFGEMSDFFYKGKECGFLNSAKLIVTFHGYDMDPKDIDKNIISYCNIIKNNPLITVNTPYLENIARKTLGDSLSIKILPVGLNTSYYKKKIVVRDQTQVDIVFCGRLIKFKGVYNLPKIANEIINMRKNENVVFHVIGDGVKKTKTKLFEDIDEFKLMDKFKFYGSLTQDEVIDVMSNCDIFILPGIYDNQRAETQGLVIQEAQSLCLPVVVSDAGGMKYGVVEGKTGYVAKWDDYDEFCDKLELLIKDEKMRINFGNAGRKFIIENYEISVLGEKLIEYYNHACFNQ